MPVTSPDNIYYLDNDSPAGMIPYSTTLATSIQEALDERSESQQLRTYRWADESEQVAQSGMQPGDEGFRVDENRRYFWSGVSWVFETGPSFAAMASGVSVASAAAGDGTFVTGAEWGAPLNRWWGDNVFASNGTATVPETGWYRISFGSNWSSSGTDQRMIRVSRNGSFIGGILVNNGSSYMSGSFPFRLDAGDELRLSLRQASGSNVTASAQFSAEYLGP